MAHNVTLALTLPITCHICLGKVREPVICTNYHVFCSVCIELWLKNNSQCPVCRVPITQENPCKNIIGGTSEDEGTLTHTGRKHLRKTRLQLLQKEYEDEIESLLQEIEELKRANLHLEERHASNPAATSISCNCANRDADDGRANIRDSLLEEWSRKLEMVNAANKKVLQDIEKLKEENQKLRNENIEFIRENLRLKNEVDLRSPQKFGRFTVAALQAKVDQYEREMSRLKKALERSDQYIEELEAQVEQLKRPLEDMQKEKSPCGNAAHVHDPTTTRSCQELKGTHHLLNQNHKTRVCSEVSSSTSSKLKSFCGNAGSPELNMTFNRYSSTLENSNEQLSIGRNGQRVGTEVAEGFGSPTSSLPFSSLHVSTPGSKPNCSSSHGHLKKPLTYLRKLVFDDMPNRGISTTSNNEINLNTGEGQTYVREPKPSFLHFCQINDASRDSKLPLQRDVGLQKDNRPDLRKYAEDLNHRVSIENTVELCDHNVNDLDSVCNGRSKSSSTSGSKMKLQIDSAGKVGKDHGDYAFSQEGGEPIASCSSSAVGYSEQSPHYMKHPAGAIQDKNFHSHLPHTHTQSCKPSLQSKEQLMFHSATGEAKSTGPSSQSSQLSQIYSNSPPAKRKMLNLSSDSPCKSSKP
ncbi:ORC ubiquitin ligase 1 [Anomaloglossus baeobatrachus]|uniref:ORC ubiquitin ligase 1 n=1 Tax=Anomaloglossus baeobatrachus TaxID=238106 RepID=UPI003F5041AA